MSNKIVVIGAGFATALLALRLQELTERDDVNCVIISFGSPGGTSVAPESVIPERDWAIETITIPAETKSEYAAATSGNYWSEELKRYAGELATRDWGEWANAVYGPTMRNELRTAMEELLAKPEVPYQAPHESQPYRGYMSRRRRYK